jgi:hypothetical protein
VEFVTTTTDAWIHLFHYSGSDSDDKYNSFYIYDLDDLTGYRQPTHELVVGASRAVLIIYSVTTTHR